MRGRRKRRRRVLYSYKNDILIYAKTSHEKEHGAFIQPNMVPGFGPVLKSSH